MRADSLAQVADGVVPSGVGVAGEGHAIVCRVSVDAAAFALEALRVDPRVRLFVAQAVVNAPLLVG